MKHWKLDGKLLLEELEQVAKLRRNRNLALDFQIVQKISEKYCSCLYLSIDQVWCGWHSVITLPLSEGVGVEGDASKCKYMQAWGEGGSHQCKCIYIFFSL